MKPNYRVWECKYEDGVVYRVMPWSDKVATENIKPIVDLETSDYRLARKKAKELGYHLSH